MYYTPERLYSGLMTIPASDLNFKHCLEKANSRIILEVLYQLPETGTKAKRKILESRLRRLRKQETTMQSPSQISAIYDAIQKKGGFHVIEEKTGLTRSEILRAVRDGETQENVEKVAHAIGYSVAELKDGNETSNF